MNPRDDETVPPTPAELAAYTDGELSTQAWMRVEAWLADHPTVAGYVDGHREVAEWFQSAPSPEPSTEEWEAALARIEHALATPPPLTLERVERRPRSGLQSWLRWTAAAAVIYVTAALLQRGPRGVVEFAKEPFPVASADEVEIISIHGQDMALFLVGTVPLQEPLALATGDDVTFEDVQPGNGAVPDVGTAPPDAISPMIVMPTSSPAPPEKAP